MIQNTKYKLSIGWLYPSLMSTYGDRGNIICLQKRCEWRGIQVEIVPIETEITDQRLTTVDLLFGGGAQDREQEIVMRDLQNEKGKIIKRLVENEVPALFVCGAPQLMGKYYEPAIGKRIEGLGIFDMYSIHPGKNSKRLIGNVAAEIQTENLNLSLNSQLSTLKSQKYSKDSEIMVRTLLKALSIKMRSVVIFMGRFFPKTHKSLTILSKKL